MLKKKMFKWMAVPALAAIAFVGLNSFTESSESGGDKIWKARIIEEGYNDYNYVPARWVHVRWITCCGAGTTTCTPSGC